MKRYDVRVTKAALADLDDCASWFDDPLRGQAWLDEVAEAIRALETMPTMPAPLRLSAFAPEVRAVLESRDYVVRQKVLGDYYIRLHVDEESAVVRILQVQPARAEDRPDLLLPDKLPPSG